MPTTDRPAFARQAAHLFLQQSYADKEMIVVDDGRAEVRHLLPDDERIRYVRLSKTTSLGQKLNLAATLAEGEILQKWDDDDYYHREFLSRTVAAIQERDPLHTVVAFDCFLVLIAATGKVVHSGNGWSAGGTLCFHRRLWERRPFRHVPRAVDWWFLKDNDPARCKIHDAELFIAVRHGGNIWRWLRKTDVTAYFARRPEYVKPLSSLVPEEDLRFYRSLQQASG